VCEIYQTEYTDVVETMESCKLTSSWGIIIILIIKIIIIIISSLIKQRS